MNMKTYTLMMRERERERQSENQVKGPCILSSYDEVAEQS